jgi:hypothetical protein
MTGYWVSQAVYVAAKLGIADLLVDGAVTCESLATATRTHAPSLQRTLRARERTAAEYETLLAAAGFELSRVVPTQAGPSIVEAVPA